MITDTGPETDQSFFTVTKTSDAASARHSSASSYADAAHAKTQVLKIVACEQCGDRFAISHDLNALDPELAERQAAWLAEQFVWDHIQETKHRSSVTLPAAPMASSSVIRPALKYRRRHWFMVCIPQ